MVQASHHPWNSLLFHFLESRSIAQWTSHEERGAVLTSEETCSQWEEAGRTEKGGKRERRRGKRRRRGGTQGKEGTGGGGERKWGENKHVNLSWFLISGSLQG